MKPFLREKDHLRATNEQKGAVWPSYIHTCYTELSYLLSEETERNINIQCIHSQHTLHTYIQISQLNLSIAAFCATLLIAFIAITCSLIIHYNDTETLWRTILSSNTFLVSDRKRWGVTESGGEWREAVVSDIKRWGVIRSGGEW